MNVTVRETYVDIAKGLAIIGVLSIHCLCKWIELPIFSFPGLLGWGDFVVAVFFFIAGFYLNEDKVLCTKDFLIGKVKSLYLPAMVTYVPIVLLHNVLFDIGWYSPSMDYGGKFISPFIGGQFVKNLFAALLGAGREPILGAMWFIFVLLFAMIVYAIVSKIARRIVFDEQTYLQAKALFFVFLCFLSFLFTRFGGLTLNRFSNTLSVVLLVYLGFLFKQVWKIKFNNPFVAVMFFLFAYSYVLTTHVGLNNNLFDNTGTLVFGTISISYLILFFSRLIENNFIGRILSVCGRESLYIMMWHFIAFKAVDYILITLNYECNLAALPKNCGSNIGLWTMYMIAGLGLPITFIIAFRKLKIVLN